MRRIRWAARAAIPAATGAVLAVLATAGPADARGNWHGGGGVYFGVPPLYLAPPLFASPYYDPYYAPRPYYPAPAATEGCYAGPYVCPLEAPSQVGMPCSCPTAQGRAWGSAR